MLKIAALLYVSVAILARWPRI